MPSFRARSLLFVAASAGALVLGASSLAAGCGSSKNADDQCALRGEGCECEYEGQTIECADTVSINADSLNCSAGTRTCSGGRWGACLNTHSTIQSMPKFSTKGATPVPCTTNPCDPGCMTFDDTPGDVDGGTVSTGDGGLTLAEGGDAPKSDAAPCTGIACNIDNCGGDYTKTQVTGKVYDPAGKNPIYNVAVYVPNSTPTAITDGVSCAACSTGTGSPIVSALTDYAGNFTLKGVPFGTNIPIVIQSGKWRRQLTLPSVTKCVSNTTVGLTGSDGLPLIRFPKNRAEGDIPRIAFVSGSADPFQCVLSKMGMDVSAATHEIGVSGTAARIHYYQGTNSAGQNLSSTLGGGAPSASTLYDTAAHLNVYDAVILSCEGNEYNKGTTINQNLVDYANAGGRIFATHYSYAYLQFASAASNWPNVVKFWNHTSNPSDPMTTIINQTFPKGDNFAKWLNFTGASPTLGRLAIQEGRHDFDYVDPTKATPWMYSNGSGAAPTPLLPGGSDCLLNSECASNNCLASTGTTAITNGTFDVDLTSWTLSGAVTGTSTTAHTGAKSMQLGNASPSTDNTATQTFTAPALPSGLSFWYRNVCLDTVTYAWATATLRDNTLGSTVTILPKVCSNPGGVWQNITTPLVASHSYTLTLANHDDNYPTDPNYTQFDDVVVKLDGACTAPTACSADTDCPGGTGRACWNGTCIPAHNMEALMTFNVPIGAAAASQCGRIVYSDFHVSASALGGSGTTFPTGCSTGDLSAQEKALEFMLFDLTSCVTPDYVPPPPPPKYIPATASRDYTASCPVGYAVQWHFFDWQTHTPGDSNIVFTVQTGNTTALLNAMTPLPLYTVTGPPITTWTGVDVALKFAATTPATKHGQILRVNIALNPSSDALQAPVLDAWRQSYTCVPEE